MSKEGYVDFYDVIKQRVKNKDKAEFLNGEELYKAAISYYDEIKDSLVWDDDEE